MDNEEDGDVLVVVGNDIDKFLLIGKQESDPLAEEDQET